MRWVRAAAIMLLAVLSLSMLLGNVWQVWGLTISPNPPIAGQSFTITSSNGQSGDIITVRTGFGCSNQAPIVGGGSVGLSGSLSLTLPAGQYSASGITSPNGCVNFTVGSLSCPENIPNPMYCGRAARDKPHPKG